MKINEILNEFDQSTQYGNNIKNEIVDYLSSLSAAGIQEPVQTDKIISFARSMGYDIQPDQIADILAGTDFGADDETIDMQNGAAGPGHQKAELNNNKVKQMANKQLKRDI